MNNEKPKCPDCGSNDIEIQNLAIGVWGACECGTDFPIDEKAKKNLEAGNP